MRRAWESRSGTSSQQTKLLFSVKSSYTLTKLIMSNFHHTCEIPSIRIDDGHILRCRVAREDGEYVDAEINLNSCIGNDNGKSQADYYSLRV